MEFRGIKAHNKRRYDKVWIEGVINTVTDQPIISIHSYDANMDFEGIAFVDLATAKKIGEHLIKLAGEGK